MELQRKNKSLFIDKEAIFALLLCQEGLLYPVTHLMDEAKMLEVDKTGLYNNQSFPFSFILAPAGKRNEEIIKTATKGEVLDLVYNNQVYGTLKVDSSFFIDKKERLLKIMGGDIYSQKAQDIYRRLGNYAICGEYSIITSLANNCFDNRITKDKILQFKKSTKAQSITSMVLDASPITRIHEHIFRLILDKNQLLILLLLRKQNEDLLDFQIRKECLEYVIENFLPKGKIMIFPLDNIYLFAGAHGIILDAILSQNLGCERIVIGENYPNLAIYYDHQKIHSIFDTTKNIKIKVKLLSEFVYCNQCNTIISTKTCPHGKHHHINYSSNFIQSILKAGLIPPTILIRKEISAKILSHLFPKRFQHIIKQYQTMFSKNGILQEQSEEDFYLKLIELYQTLL